MSDNKLKRIIIHHTAGTYNPNSTDLKSYHYIISGGGDIFSGIYSPEDNIDCTDGKYAAHTKQGNTGSIGIALACNRNYNIKTKDTKYPLTRKQYESLCSFVASLMRVYKIPIDQVMTHYEFNQKNNIKTGKVDITYLPHAPDILPQFVGQQFRKTIMWYYKEQQKQIDYENEFYDY